MKLTVFACSEGGM